MEYANRENDIDNELIIDLSNSDYISPDVLCDLLSYFKVLQQKRFAVIPHLEFGLFSKAKMYFINSNFFLMSEQNSLFTTDVELSIGKGSMAQKTGKFMRETFNSLDISRSMTRLRENMYLQINALFNISKINQMENLSIYDPLSLLDGMGEIIENSYLYSKDEKNRSCFYTFQTYLNSGFTFACSDTGIGFYKSLMDIYFRQYDTRKKLPKIYSREDFKALNMNPIKRNIAGIIESLVLNIEPGYVADYGFPYILQNLVLKNDGVLYIQNENILMRIDSDFLNQYFKITSEERWFGNRKTTEARIIGFNAANLRDLVYHAATKPPYTLSDSICVLKYSFPGVHISLHTTPQKKELGQ